MDEDQINGLTSGYLPLAAFQHLESTAVGVVDLDRSITPSTPDGRPWDNGQRDGLLLIRVHDEPVAVVHVDTLSGVADGELAHTIWRSAGAEICRHLERQGCAQIPSSADELLDELRFATDTCSEGRPTNLGMSVAVILSTAGRDEQLGRCLRSLLTLQRAGLEIVVVDNRPATGETRRTVCRIASDDQRVRYVAEPRTGLSVARNRGVSETHAELVAFIDDDAVVDKGWLDWLAAPFSEPRVTATCGMVLPLELQTEAQKRFERYGGYSKGMERRVYDLRTGRATRPLLYPFLGDVFGCGSSMAFRRADLVAAGGFDTALGAGTPAGGGEDIYALSTAILRGGQLIYEPRSLCWHEHRKDGNDLQGQLFSYGVGLGAVMTKAMVGNPHFYTAAARSAPTVLRSRGRPRASADRQAVVEVDASTSRDELLRSHRRGILRGPLRYAQGVVRARKLGLGGVIRGG